MRMVRWQVRHAAVGAHAARHARVRAHVARMAVRRSVWVSVRWRRTVWRVRTVHVVVRRRAVVDEMRWRRWRRARWPLLVERWWPGWTTAGRRRAELRTVHGRMHHRSAAGRSGRWRRRARRA